MRKIFSGMFQCSIIVLFLVTTLQAQYFSNMQYSSKTTLSPGVTWQTATNANPAWSIHIFEVDMTNPAVRVMPVFKQAGNVSGSANERTSSIGSRSGGVAAVNAGYFTTDGTRLTNSYTMIEGEFIGGSGTNMQPENNRSVLGFSAHNQEIAVRTKLRNNFEPHDPENWDQITDVIAGRGHFVTSNGVLTVQDNENTTSGHHGSRHPRTAIGFSENPYRVYLVTVDGRHEGVSIGMTYTELGQLMADLGVEQSISLDGGGSTTAWVSGEGVVNSPSDGSERSVVSAWVIIPVSMTFSAGDRVRTTADPSLNLRSGPGTDNSIIKAVPYQSVAQVQPHDDNGVRRTNNNWWHVEMQECGTSGWLAEFFLQKEGFIDDFSTYADTNALRQKWQSGGNDYGWSVITLQTSGGAEDSGSFLEMTDAGWLAATEATYDNIVPRDGTYTVSFYYMNGHKNNAINDRLNFEIYRGEELLSQTPLQTSVVDEWTQVETENIDLIAGDSLRIHIDGNTSATMDVAFALDQIQIQELEQVAKPVLDPVPGIYDTPQEVTLSCSTADATIHYTTDGSDPAISGTSQSGTPGESVQVSVPMNTTIQIRAYATHNERDDSDETSGTYTVEPQLNALHIEGPDELNLDSYYQYHARAHYSDGSNNTVAAVWSLQFPEVEELFTDDFTGYANQSAFESAWEPHSDGSLQLSTEEVRSTQSAMQDNTAQANYYNLPDNYQGTDSEPLVFEFWMYDSDPSLTNARHFISLASFSGGSWGSGTLENLIAMGMHPPSGAYYNARILYGGEGWVLTTAQRTQGWRKMTIKITSSLIEFYVDDTPAYQSSYTTPATGWNSIRLGSSLSSTNNLTVYYDDISMYQEIVSQDPPAEINSSGFLTTFGDVGEGVLNASYTENGNTQTDSLNITIMEETTISDWYFY